MLLRHVYFPNPFSSSATRRLKVHGFPSRQQRTSKQYVSCLHPVPDRANNAQALVLLFQAGGEPVREAKLHGNLAATKLARNLPFEALEHCRMALKVGLGSLMDHDFCIQFTDVLQLGGSCGLASISDR